MRRGLIVLALLPGCFEEPPDIAAEGTTGSETDTLPTLSPTATGPSGVTSEPTSLSSTSAGPSSGPTTDPDDDGSGSEESSSTTGGEESSGGSGTAESGSDSTGPGWPHAYHDCYAGDVPDSERLCDGSCVINEANDLSACAPDCAAGACDGADEYEGTCLTAIAQGSPPPLCVIVCGDDGQPWPGDVCPEGMTCETIDGFATFVGQVIYACVWE